MNIYEKMGDTVIVYMPSEVDDYAAGKITEATEEIFEGQDIRHVVFDFRITTFMDSSGIGVVIGRCRNMNYSGGKVVAENMNERIRKIFVVSGLHKLVQMKEGEKK